MHLVMITFRDETDGLWVLSFLQDYIPSEHTLGWLTGCSFSSSLSDPQLLHRVHFRLNQAHVVIIHFSFPHSITTFCSQKDKKLHGFPLTYRRDLLYNRYLSSTSLSVEVQSSSDSILYRSGLVLSPQEHKESVQSICMFCSSFSASRWSSSLTLRTKLKLELKSCLAILVLNQVESVCPNSCHFKQPTLSDRFRISLLLSKTALEPFLRLGIAFKCNFPRSFSFSVNDQVQPLRDEYLWSCQQSPEFIWDTLEPQLWSHNVLPVFYL